MRVLVTGATGYIGGRLIPRLIERGHGVRILVRDPRRIAGRPWFERVEVAQADLMDSRGLRDALDGMDAAYYLVHSMYAHGSFVDLDRRAARNFIEAAGGIRQVIYLGGLLPQGPRLSAHLSSRAEVGAMLREHLPALEFRAGPVIGAGSGSFEMLRYLTERLPLMITPRWVSNEVQPIAIEDVLAYLLLGLERSATGIVEIGGERLTFRKMMEEYAAVRGLKRTIVPVPVLAPALAARWVGLITPIPNRLAVPLIQGVISPVVADTTRAEHLFPEVRPIRYREAVRMALDHTLAGRVETRWSSALGGGPAYEVSDWEGLIREVRSLHVAAPPEQVFRVFTSLGGDRGWLVWNWAWRLRGWFDRISGGPGLRRGRRDPRELLAGEAVDFWRVEEIDPPRLLRLRAEMRMPGKAWLQWEAQAEAGGTRLVQTAGFEPDALAGWAYWWGLYPIHRLVFSDLVRAIAREALKAAQQMEPAPGSPEGRAVGGPGAGKP